MKLIRLRAKLTYFFHLVISLLDTYASHGVAYLDAAIAVCPATRLIHSKLDANADDAWNYSVVAIRRCLQEDEECKAVNQVDGDVRRVY